MLSSVRWHSMQWLSIFGAMFWLCWLSAGVHATPASLPLVTKQRFEITDFQTQNNQRIAKVQVGWEAYGKLNATKSNVILITHYFPAALMRRGNIGQKMRSPGIGMPSSARAKPLILISFMC